MQLSKFNSKTNSFVAVLAAFLLAGCGSTPTQSGMAGMDHSKAEKPVTSSGTAAKGGGTYLDQPLSKDLLQTSFFDSTGKSFTLESKKGKYLVIANFLTSCQEICPMTAANIRDVGEAINKAGLTNSVEAMIISVDGERDLPARLNAYKDFYGSNNWTVASGTSANLAKLWKFFGAPAMREEFNKTDAAKLSPDWQTGAPVKYDMVHADLVVIIDDMGHWRWLALGSPKVGPAGIPSKLKDYLSPQGLVNLTKPEEPTWTTSAIFSALTELTGKTIK